MIHWTPEELADMARYDVEIDALDHVAPENTAAYLPKKSPRLSPRAAKNKREYEKAYQKTHREQYNQRRREWYQRNRTAYLASLADRRKQKKAASSAANTRNGRLYQSPTV